MSYLARHSRLLSCTKLLSTAIFIVIISASICASAGDGNDDSSQKTVKISSTQTESLTRYGDVPLAFEPNQGQAGEEVRFMSRTEGFNLLLRNREMVFRVSDPDTSKSASIVMRYMSASFRKQPQGLEKQTGVSNYLIGPNPANWHTEVPNYAKVTYEAIYPGVDLVFYGNHRSLEHDFRIAARADYKQIRVQLNEADRLTINADGDLIVKAGSGRLTFLAPKIYQLQHNKKVNVSGRYVLLAEKEFGFQLGSYDKTLPIVIDPILSYSTYLAGSSNDIASAITVDTNGNAYITGYTSSIDFPVKGAEQGKCSNTCNAQDVFVTKLNATGSALIYSTFVGGTGSDQGNAIAVDSLGNVAVAGMTSSYDFPQSNGTSVVLSTYGSHGFALSLNPSGGTFNFSTYLAGISQDSATGVAFDSTGNVYVSGYTNSSNFPVTPGHQIGPAPTGSYYGGNDIFLVKLARRGKLLFSTMVGGTSTSYYGTFPNLPVAVAVDSAGEALLCGTAYDGFPTTAGSFQQIYQGTTFGASNAFVAKLNASGTAFSSATYLGGNGSDAAIQVALDSTQNVYVAGTSYSMNFPTTPGAFQTTNLQAGQVSFITKMNPGLSSLIYSTYLGGTSSNYGRGVLATGLAVDSAGKSYVVGSSTQTDFPIASPFISEPPANYYGIGGAAFLSVLNSTGSALTFSTYFSGSTGTAGTGVAVDRGGHALITGSTSDKDLPTTSGSFQPAIPVSTYSQQHAFVAKILMTQANSSACLVNNTVWFNSLYGKPATGSFQIRNCGTSTLKVNGTVSSSPVFTVTYSNCQSVLPGASCTIKLKYVPLANSYGDNGTLTVTDNDPIPSQILQLSGYVSWPQTGIYPGYQLGFGDDVVGVTSSAVLYRVQNYGNVPLHITAVTATGDFAGVNHCPTALQSGGYCDIGATFTPTVAGPDSGTLLVYDDAQNSPQSLTLSGNGLSVYPAPSNLSMFPGYAALGSAAVPVYIYGNDVFPTTTVNINGKLFTGTITRENGGLQFTLPAWMLTKIGSLSIQLVNPSPGGPSAPLDFSVYRQTTLGAADMLYEPFTRKFYASIPASASTNPNSLVTIDPNTGAVGSPIAIGNDPGALGLSDDGQILYVSLKGDNAVIPFNITTQTAGTKIPLGVDVLKGALTASDIQVQPGNSNTIVVTLAAWYQGSDGIALIENGQIVSEYLNDAPNNVYVGGTHFVSASELYGWDTGYASTGLLHFVIFGNQLLEAPGIPAPYGVGAFDVSGTNLFDINGQVFDTATNAVVANVSGLGTYPSAPVAVFSDVSSNRIFFINGMYGNGGSSVFDATSLMQLGVAGGPVSGSARVQKWGADGLAYLTSSSYGSPQDLVQLRSSLFYPSSSLNPVAIPTALSPSSATLNGSNFVLTVTGSQFVAGAVVKWNGSSRTTRFVDSGTLAVDIPASDIATTGTAKVTVVNPAPGGGTSAVLELKIM